MLEDESAITTEHLMSIEEKLDRLSADLQVVTTELKAVRDENEDLRTTIVALKDHHDQVTQTVRR